MQPLSDDVFTETIQAIYPRLVGFAVQLTRDESSAFDLVQNTVLKVWEKRQNLLVHSSLQSYMFRAVRNEFLDEKRRNGRVTSLDEEQIKVLEAELQEDQTSLFENRLRIVKEEIQKLPPKCRQVFLMSKQQSYTNQEIAEELSISIKAVEAHMTKAYKLLRNALGGRTEELLLFFFWIRGERWKGHF